MVTEGYSAMEATVEAVDESDSFQSALCAEVYLRQEILVLLHLDMPIVKA